MAKPKLTKDLIEKICGLIAEGNYNSVAAQACGICEATLYNWIQRGEQGKSGLYVDFLEAFKKAEADAEAKYLGVIKDAANDGTWQAAAWYLERKHYDRWGRKERRELSGPDGGAIPFSVEEWKKSRKDRLSEIEDEE